PRLGDSVSPPAASNRPPKAGRQASCRESRNRVRPPDSETWFRAPWRLRAPTNPYFVSCGLAELLQRIDSDAGSDQVSQLAGRTVGREVGIDDGSHDLVRTRDGARLGEYPHTANHRVEGDEVCELRFATCNRISVRLGCCGNEVPVEVLAPRNFMSAMRGPGLRALCHPRRERGCESTNDRACECRECGYICHIHLIIPHVQKAPNRESLTPPRPRCVMSRCAIIATGTSLRHVPHLGATAQDGKTRP